MVRRAYVVVGLATSAVLATLAAANLSRGSLLGEQHAAGPGKPPVVQVHRPPTSHGSDSSGLPTWLVVSMTILLALYALCLFVLVVLHRRRDEEDDEEERPWTDELEDADVWRTVLEVDLAQAAEVQLAALHQGSPRNAIVACWMGLQAATAGAGMPGVDSDTPEEYLLRAVQSLRLDPPAITTLADLYREARFSRHQMDEQHRELAGRALRVLADQLTAHRADQPGARRTGNEGERMLHGVSR